MTIEQDIIKNKAIRCSWCGRVGWRKKVYASPEGDLQNPGAYHEKCLRAMIKLANKLAKIEIKTRK